MQQGNKATTRESRKHQVIHLLLEGNWLPLHNVLVNQVGKYRYKLENPHTNHHVDIIVEIILAGRTKVISIHSPIWIANNTTLPLRLRLHVPTSTLVAAQALRNTSTTGAPFLMFVCFHRCNVFLALETMCFRHVFNVSILFSFVSTTCN